MESQARSTASPLAPKKPCFSCRQLVKGSALRRLFSSLQFDAVLQSSDDHHSCCWPTCASSVPTTLRAKLVAADLGFTFLGRWCSGHHHGIIGVPSGVTGCPEIYMHLMQGCLERSICRHPKSLKPKPSSLNPKFLTKMPQSLPDFASGPS